MVVEFFKVVVGGFRWLQVVPCFSNYARRATAKAPATLKYYHFGSLFMGMTGSDKK